MTDRIKWYLIYNTTKKNAAKRGRPFTLTPEQFRRLVDRSEGRCMMTGIPFETKWYDGCRRPFMPSIDRIDSSKGYSDGNVRLVCVLVNLAMNEWGIEPLLRVARNLVARESEVIEQARSSRHWQASGYFTVKEYLTERGTCSPPMIRHITRYAHYICKTDGIESMYVPRQEGKPRKDGSYLYRSFAAFPVAVLDRAYGIHEENVTGRSAACPKEDGL